MEIEPVGTVEEGQKSVWAEYRKWRKIFWYGIPIAAGILVLSGFHAAAGITVGFLTIIAINLFQSFKCPSCGDCFFYDRYCDPTAKCCVHCKFPKWAEPAKRRHS